MINKKIVFTSPRTVEVQDVDILPPEKKQVQVKLDYSTISNGTERANLVGGQRTSFHSNATTKYPKTVGYSSAGTVVAVGEGVTSLNVGDRVCLSWSKHAYIQNIKEEWARKIPDSVTTKEASLFHIGTFPLAAIRKCTLEIGESAIVMGQGILGLFAVSLLRAAGAAPIIAVDPIPKKRAKALTAGADYALDPFAEGFCSKVKSITDGGAKVAIEVTGSGKALDQVLDCMAPYGRVALLGCTRNSDFTIDYYRKVHGPGISLIGAHTHARPKFESSPGMWTEKDDIYTQVKLTELKRLDLGALIDEVHSPLEAKEVFGRLADDPTFPLVQFDWSMIENEQ